MVIRRSATDKDCGRTKQPTTALPTAPTRGGFSLACSRAGTDELGSQVLPAAPGDFVVAALGGHIRSKAQREVIGDIESLDMESHAAFRNIGHEAVVNRSGLIGGSNT